jgi:hypothetical protein
MFKNNHLRHFYAAALILFLSVSLAAAEVVRVDIVKRTDVLDGRTYGTVSAYEWLEGRAHFALDPSNPLNDNIVDLKLAPRNAQGLVEFSADVSILRPKVAANANGVVIFDVVNRGRPTVLEYLNRGDRTAATGSAEFFGDDFLMKQGATLVWLGWQQDLPASAGMMRLAGPVIKGVSGWVYGEFTVAARVADVSLGDRTSIPYAVADKQDEASVLAVSPSRSQQPRAIPGEHWAFARMQDGELKGDDKRVWVEDGFVPGAIYQFAYRAEQPQIAGLGLAGVRDLMSWMRHEPAATVRGNIVYKHAYAFGISQSGRFLRQFLHEGFNQDTAGRQVFDGMMVHIAGGARRGFNERFSQPSRTTGSRVFPFTDMEQTDSETGETGGMLTRATRAKVAPKIIYTSSSWEYWGSAASAIHTTLAGEDIAIPDSSRVYLFAGTQHVPARLPLSSALETRGQLPPNPMDYRPALRALYVALDQWVRAGVAPPASRYPKVAERGLVPRAALNEAGFQGINVPATPQPAFRLDNGEKMSGIPSIVPPKVGKPYVVLVPQLDNDGNELPGIRMPTLAAPLATHTGWNLRSPEIGAPRELVQLVGGMHPFARTRDERAPGDARASITERYPSRDGYLERVVQEAASLVQQRLMVKEDVGHVISSAGALWDYVMQGARPTRTDR